MATYTDNYQLTKPTYAEQADIGVINSNMNIIDDIMHSSQVSLAPAYDQSQTYAEGDVVMYELLMYKCISPTTGAWDGSKWERTTASESGGGGSAELDILGEASGAVASFADGASAELAKCIVDINPTQDLHGYSKPWAGGAGKNKLNVSLSRLKIINIGGTWSGNTYSFRGITFEVTASDGATVDSIKANGTASGGQAYMIIADAQMLTMESDEEYILSNDTNGYAESVYNGSSSSASTTGTLTFTFSGFTSSWNMTIGVPNGATATDVIFRPMVRKSSVSDATYEPYANICPISGSTSVTVTISDGETSTTKTTPLGQTVYGGQLNVLTGELTVDRAIVDLGSFNWVSENATVSGLARVGVEEIRPLGVLYNQTPICSSYEGVTPKEYTAFNNGEIGFSNNATNPMIRVRDQNFASMTDAQVKSAMNGVTLCYKLATPQTVQLTPQEVNSLLGQNNISADTGDVDIVYVKASAPIQPNPTGTPTATLKKLGIEGTVFELEGGGGGSSSGINYSTAEQVIGTWIDGKPLYQKTFDLTAVQLTDNNWNNNILGTIGIRIKHFEGLFSIGQTEPIVPYNYIRSTTQFFTTTLNDDASDINVRPNMNVGTLYAGIVTIQYTKITD